MPLSRSLHAATLPLGALLLHWHGSPLTALQKLQCMRVSRELEYVRDVQVVPKHISASGHHAATLPPQRFLPQDRGEVRSCSGCSLSPHPFMRKCPHFEEKPYSFGAGLAQAGPRPARPSRIRRSIQPSPLAKKDVRLHRCFVAHGPAAILVRPRPLGTRCSQPQRSNGTKRFAGENGWWSGAPICDSLPSPPATFSASTRREPLPRRHPRSPPLAPISFAVSARGKF